MATGASSSPPTPAPPPPSTLARTSPPPSTLDSSRTSPPPSIPCLRSREGQVMDGGGGAPQMRTDAGEPEMGALKPETAQYMSLGDDPHMRTDAGGRKKPETLQCKNSELPRSQRKKPNESSLVPSARSPTSQPGTAGDGGRRPQCENKDGSRRKKLNESCLPTTIIKEKYQKVVEANDKIEKQVLPLKKSQTQVGEGKLPANRSEPRKPRSEKSRNNKSASPGVSSPTQVTSSPGVNYLVRAAAVKREALRRGSPSTPQPPSQNQLGSPSLQDLSPDTRATMSQASKLSLRKLTLGKMRNEILTRWRTGGAKSTCFRESFSVNSENWWLF